MARPWRAYAQLVRLPNVFTALADISLGILLLRTTTEKMPWLGSIALLLTSACLYSAGMAWNDFFDIEQDRRERPFRPLPSGRITRVRAAQVGAGLMICGLIMAIMAGTGFGKAFWVTLLLVTAILAYDGWLKKTFLGPVGMGLCRFLNILLGLSLIETAALPWSERFYLAGIVGTYIIGVTWFARTEARQSNRPSLIMAALVMLSALGIALAAPVCVQAAQPSWVFPYLLLGLGFFVGIPVVRALEEPTPKRVQPAVKSAIVGLIILDAALATGLVGAVGLVLLLWLLPTLYLGRWIYST
jgi:4-hydroxybenzoate polyprenyltransferase